MFLSDYYDDCGDNSDEENCGKRSNEALQILDFKMIKNYAFIRLM